MSGDGQTGRTLGRYLVEETIGSGGFATVYRAVDTVLERPVALKVLDPSAHRNPTVARRFVNEGRSVARLDHPAIVPVYDVGEADGLLWMAMRLVDGVTLDGARAGGRRFGPAEIAAVVGRIAGALDHAHAQGVVHRDVKPSNILLEGGDPARAWLADFGIAATARTAGRYTTGTLGTAAYMAPEQARPSEVGPPADVYSLGCVVYGLVAGRPPFPGDDHVGLLMAHATEPVPPIGDDALDEVLARALAKAPADRPASAGALADELRSAVAGTAVPDGYEADADTALGSTAAHRAVVAEIEDQPTLAYGSVPTPAAPPDRPPPPRPAGSPAAPAGLPGEAAVSPVVPAGPSEALVSPGAGAGSPEAVVSPAAPAGPPPPPPVAPSTPAQGAPADPVLPVPPVGAAPAGPPGTGGGPGSGPAGGTAGPGGEHPPAPAPAPGDRPSVGVTRRPARWLLVVGLAVVAAAAGAVALAVTLRSSGADRQCDAAGICFELPEDWALGPAESGVGSVERGGRPAATYRHQPLPGPVDDLVAALADADVCDAEPTEVDVGGTAGARCDNPDGSQPEVITATVAGGRVWSVSFRPGLPAGEVDEVVAGISFFDPASASGDRG